MLYVRACNLSASDLALLGNNIRPPRRIGTDADPFAAHRRANRRIVAAVNRSLSSLREQVGWLDMPAASIAAGPALAARPA